MTTANTLYYASLLEVSEQLRVRELTPVELTQATLARIDRLNPSLGAYYTVFAETALAEARRAEAEIAKGRWRGPLHGVPIAFKDLYSLGPTTAGSRLLADHVDQFQRILTIADGQKDYLQGVIEFFQTQTGTKMMIAAERLAVIAAVTLPITALSSIMGMNVIVNSQSDPVFITILLLVMVTTSIYLLNWAKRRGWW